MSIKVFADGSPLLASEINTNLMNQSVIVTTSARISMPAAVEGMTVYETDTDKLLTYISTTVGWQLPWNMPWGVVGVSTGTTAATALTTSAATISTLADVTWTAVANRRYRTTLYMPIISMSNASTLVGYITDGASAIKQQVNLTVGAGADGPINCVLYETVSSGSTTRRARGLVTAGTGTVTASATNPHFLMVEDIGPSAAPVA